MQYLLKSMEAYIHCCGHELHHQHDLRRPRSQRGDGGGHERDTRPTTEPGLGQ